VGDVSEPRRVEDLAGGGLERRREDGVDHGRRHGGDGTAGAGARPTYAWPVDLRDPWPLSAAATAVLLDPGTKGADVLKLSLKELVLREVWRLERRPGGRRGRTQHLALIPGGEGVPGLVPLPTLHERLRSTAGEQGRSVEAVVARLTGLRSGLPGELRRAAREDLAAGGLVTLERGMLPRTTRVVSTAAGEALEREAPERGERLVAALEATADLVEARRLVAAAGGLALVAAPGLVAALRALDARIAAAGAAGGPHVPEEARLDFDFPVLDALDATFDMAIDAGGGGGGGGGGGDGGGG